ncbi:MAG: putative DNA-binding protein [Epulopiscium sp.]|jgi:predicted DNA-binding protein YlxM (UPF0122 family)|nr:putative DNA-binding protein [Candidatus Epulonipiscium sp.]
MEKLLEITLLYDFYGELLTDRQKNIFELYYQNDLSLAEIADNLNISRQGVYDTLKRSENILYDYEDKLKLVERFEKNRSYIKEIINKINEAEKNIDDMAKVNECFVKLKSIANKLIIE